MLESYWLYVLFALALIAFLFVFFWVTPANEETAEKNRKPSIRQA